MNFTSDHISLRPPQATDGADLHQLVSQCPPLDTNSMYCNLLHCSHFAQTAVAAKAEDKLVGFVSGYLKPARPDTLFVWQVAVSTAARGMGLATRMLQHILSRPICADVDWLETTITQDNSASWKLFEGYARKHNLQTSRQVLFDKKEHFNGEHESEFLLRIGPIQGK